MHTGSFTDDYRSVMFHDRLEGHMYAATGLANSILANRVSWFFNLKGPSINLDTACSSSLTALHLACQDLRTGTTDMVRFPTYDNFHKKEQDNTNPRVQNTGPCWRV